MISSAITNRNVMWAYFFTEAQADIYLSDLYENAVTSARKLILDVDRCLCAYRSTERPLHVPHTQVTAFT